MFWIHEIPRTMFHGMSIPVRLLFSDHERVVGEPLVMELGESVIEHVGRGITIVSDMRAKYARCCVVTLIFHSLFGIYFILLDSTSFQSRPLSLVITRYPPVHTRLVNAIVTL